MSLLIVMNWRIVYVSIQIDRTMIDFLDMHQKGDNGSEGPS